MLYSQNNAISLQNYRAFSNTAYEVFQMMFSTCYSVGVVELLFFLINANKEIVAKHFSFIEVQPFLALRDLYVCASLSSAK